MKLPFMSVQNLRQHMILLWKNLYTLFSLPICKYGENKSEILL